jgi:hypothetical protein
VPADAGLLCDKSCRARGHDERDNCISLASARLDVILFVILLSPSRPAVLNPECKLAILAGGAALPIQLLSNNCRIFFFSFYDSPVFSI